uniref:Uncharacterized protein n=1 Tax=Cannabis sativa TaxID=3483 RepID=A0A803NI58_CANSA
MAVQAQNDSKPHEASEEEVEVDMQEVGPPDIDEGYNSNVKFVSPSRQGEKTPPAKKVAYNAPTSGGQPLVEIVVDLVDPTSSPTDLASKTSSHSRPSVAPSTKARHSSEVLVPLSSEKKEAKGTDEDEGDG